MRIFIVMGLPYQGKTTTARELLAQLRAHPLYQDREIGYVSTDKCRGKLLKEEYPEDKVYKYTAIQEAQAWRVFLAEVVTFLTLSPTNGILIIDGTLSQWSKMCELLDILTVNIEAFATQRLPLVIEFVHVGSQYGERMWMPSMLPLQNETINSRWKSRCMENEAIGLSGEVPENVLNRKKEEMQETLNMLTSTCKCFMKSYRGLIYFARHFLRHHPKAQEIHKII